jgi:hypothetical protein
MIFSVIDKGTGEEVYRYEADAPIEWSGMEFATHDHVEPPTINTNGSIESQVIRVWTVVEYKRRFTQEERIAVRNASGQSKELDDYLDLLKDAQEVRSDDPDILKALSDLEQFGLIAPGRAQEILNGN